MTINEDTAFASPTAALKALDAKAMGSTIRVPYEQTQPLPGFNVRTKNKEYDDAVRSLADSILENGYYDHKPLAGIVMESDPSKVGIYEGGTRWDAIALAIKDGAAIADVPVALAPAGTTVEDLTVAMVQGNEGRPFTPMEKANAAKRLLSFDPDKKKASKRLGMTVRYLDQLLVLIGAPASVRKSVENNEIAAAEAVKVVRADPKKAAETVKKRVAEAKAAGKTKATPKTAAAAKDTGPKMKAIKATVNFAEGDNIKDGIVMISKAIREEFDHNGEDILGETGSVDVIIRVIDHAAEAKKAAKVEADKKKAAASKVTKKAATKAKTKPKAKPAAKKAPAKKTATKAKATKAKPSDDMGGL